MDDLPVRPPVPPMLAKLARELPLGREWAYEPKWDGFRCLAFRNGDDVDLRSRNNRPMGRYFPEVVAALSALPERRLVLDGELLVTSAGRIDFPALMARLHPAATRVALLREQTPAELVVFDVLAVGGDDLTGAPFRQRRARLAEALTAAPAGLRITEATGDVERARAWLDATQPGADGVVAKRRDSAYEPGRRVMVKVKRDRTADCVVAGFRLFADPPAVSSLLLGMYDAGGVLHHVGVVTAMPKARRGPLLRELLPLRVALEGHPWEHGFGLEGGALGRLKGTAGRWTPAMPRDWEPLAPVLVAEVAYDAVEGSRFRHPARFRLWRADRDARGCRIEQLTAGR
jgi:ATP-dependent DNA ligase